MSKIIPGDGGRRDGENISKRLNPFPSDKSCPGMVRLCSLNGHRVKYDN